MKIYTKTGDGGKTSLYSGKRVSKSNVRIHSYGALDELNSHIGLLRDQISNLEEIENTGEDLMTIQSWIFSLGSHLANDSADMVNSLPKVKSEWILVLEEKIDKMTSELIPLKNFILPGGNLIISQTHITRAICRRAERLTIELQNSLSNDDVPLPKSAIPLLNRLSDYLFTLSRWFSAKTGATEIDWKPM